jgi:hypothetical protein
MNKLNNENNARSIAKTYDGFSHPCSFRQCLTIKANE